MISKTIPSLILNLAPIITNFMLIIGMVSLNYHNQNAYNPFSSCNDVIMTFAKTKWKVS